MPIESMTFEIEKLSRVGDAYKLLAACFYEPDKEIFTEERVCENIAAVLKDVIPEVEPVAQEMQKAMAAISEEALLIDYARLFVGPFEILAPPYGSVYLEQANQVMGASTMTILKKYLAAGLTLDIKGPPDHIAFELEFLHYLSRLEIDAYDHDDDNRQQVIAVEKQDFLHTFLAPWVPSFSQRIRSNTDNGFYRNLADCLEKTIISLADEQVILHKGT